VPNGKTNDEMKRIQMEAVMVSSRHYVGICLDGPRKTMKNIGLDANVLAKTKSEHLMNTNHNDNPFVPKQYKI
jgi:hypothetical protein